VARDPDLSGSTQASGRCATTSPRSAPKLVELRAAYPFGGIDARFLTNHERPFVAALAPPAG